jgi:hypothetical protein
VIKITSCQLKTMSSENNDVQASDLVREDDGDTIVQLLLEHSGSNLQKAFKEHS